MLPKWFAAMALPAVATMMAIAAGCAADGRQEPFLPPDDPVPPIRSYTGPDISQRADMQVDRGYD